MTRVSFQQAEDRRLRAEYAKYAEFLLTTNHKESEQCFTSTVGEAFKEQAVFKK